MGGLVIPHIQSFWLLPLSLVTLLFTYWPRAARRMLIEALVLVIWVVAGLWMISGRFPDPVPRSVGTAIWVAAVLFPWVAIVRARRALALIVAHRIEWSFTPGSAES